VTTRRDVTTDAANKRDDNVCAGHKAGRRAKILDRASTGRLSVIAHRLFYV